MTAIRRVLILSTKAGAGHLRAAAALETAFRRDHPAVEARHADALEYTTTAFRNSYTRGYEDLVSRLPSVWGMIYARLEHSGEGSRIKKLSRLNSRLHGVRLRRLAAEFDPDEIVCTHYLPAEILGRLRAGGKLRARLSVVLTDYDIHTMWVQKGVERYFVATEEMAYALRRHGVGEAEVHVTGIPILPAFSETYPPRPAMRRKLGLPDAPATVLLAAGGFGMAPVDVALRALLEETDDARFVALAGRNEKLRAAVESVAAAHPGRVTVCGYVDNMHEWMAAADLIVTKCGGLTTSECLAMGLPMVIIAPIPGQEERNSDFLLERGVAVRANSMAHVVYKVCRLLDDPAQRERMRRAALQAAKPRAASDIVSRVMGATHAVRV